MTANFPCHLLIHDPAPGAWNMAVDEILIDESLQHNTATLRFYQWQYPSVSLGYFQNYEERNEHTTSLDIEVVRRLSGGGAIIHDQELTYSLILPPSHFLAQDTQGLYDAVHTNLVDYLQNSIFSNSKSSNVFLCPESSSKSQKDQPFLCFQRRSKGDILFSNSLAAPSEDALTHKIVGSAQRRKRGVVLQHGSILLAQSLAAPELPGILELSDLTLASSDLIDCLPRIFAKSLNLDLQSWELPELLLQGAEELASNKYLSSSWTRRR